MSTTSNDPVITSYARAPARTMLVIYPDSGHGGIFQFHDTFAPVAVEFLDR